MLGAGVTSRCSPFRPNDPNGTRTRVTAVKGRCPRPLDDGAAVTKGVLAAMQQWAETANSRKRFNRKEFRYVRYTNRGQDASRGRYEMPLWDEPAFRAKTSEGGKEK